MTSPPPDAPLPEDPASANEGASAVTKAVIPAAGLGTRFLPATKAQPKEMLAIVDKPAIQYAVEEAVGAGVDDILIVTSRAKQAIEDHFDRSFELERRLEAAGKLEALQQVRAVADLAHVHYVRQGEPLGLGHAVAMGRHHVGRHPFAVLLPDDVFPGSSTALARMVGLHQRYGATVLALKQVARADISAYGSAGVEAVDGAEPTFVRVREVVEKPHPDEAPSDLAVLGRYVFTPDIFEAIDAVKPGAGGEIQVTDAVGLLLDDQPVYGYVFPDTRYDSGNKLDYLRATVELALERDDLGPAFADFLVDLVRRRLAP